MALGLPGPIICPIRGIKPEENLGKNLERHRPARPPAKYSYVILAIAAGLLAVTAACGNTAASTPPPVIPTVAPSETPAATAMTAATLSASSTENPIKGPFVRVDEVVFPVELAAESEERIRGLSGRASLNSGMGMLFVFENAERFRFWMKEMQFTLDIVWIGPDCQVVDVSENVPFPDPSTPLGELPRYSPESPAQYVLEINGGEAAYLGLGIGDLVKFLGGIDGRYGC